jgi:hypothetical protein
MTMKRSVFRALMIATCLMGYAFPGSARAEEKGHGHGAGPHDGTLTDWGGGAYHVEFTVDHGKKEATVYIIGSDEKSPSPIKAQTIQLFIDDPETELDLVAKPLPGEAAGLSSRFVGSHATIGIVKEFSGTISGVVEGTPYTGDFKEEPHGAHGHGHAHGHSHGDDDALVWRGEPRQHAGLEIKLGHHGKKLHGGKEVEPAVSITRGGQPVSDAKVFNALVAKDGTTVLVREVATTYEPTTDEEPAHYAQGGLIIPKGTTEAIVRFRIVPAAGDATTFDMVIPVE